MLALLSVRNSIQRQQVLKSNFLKNFIFKIYPLYGFQYRLKIAPMQFLVNIFLIINYYIDIIILKSYICQKKNLSYEKK